MGGRRVILYSELDKQSSNVSCLTPKVKQTNKTCNLQLHPHKSTPHQNQSTLQRRSHSNF
jgi:hypothetical protein